MASLKKATMKSEIAFIILRYNPLWPFAHTHTRPYSHNTHNTHAHSSPSKINFHLPYLTLLLASPLRVYISHNTR